MMRVSGSDTSVMPVCWRRKRLPRLLMPWRLPTTPCFTLPVAVKRKRFLAPLLVFILGIFLFLFKGLALARRSRPEAGKSLRSSRGNALIGQAARRNGAYSGEGMRTQARPDMAKSDPE